MLRLHPLSSVISAVLPPGLDASGDQGSPIDRSIDRSPPRLPPVFDRSIFVGTRENLVVERVQKSGLGTRHMVRGALKESFSYP